MSNAMLTHLRAERKRQMSYAYAASSASICLPSRVLEQLFQLV